MSNDPGSEVWRFDLDLDGDGQPEILLANQELAGKHGDMEWEVYKYVKGSQYRFLGRLDFSRVSFQVLHNPARVEALWFGDAHDRAEGHTVRSADLATYLVAPTGITLSANAELEEADIEAKMAQMDAWHEAVKLRLLGARVDKDGKFESPTWYDFETGEPAAGVTNLEGLVVDSSLSPLEKTTSAAEWNDQGLRFLQQKKYDRAVLEFGNANSMAGYRNAQYANNLGFALYKAQRYEEAVEWFKKTIGIDPNRAVAYLNLGDALVRLNRSAEAREAYAKYLGLAPNSKSAADVKNKLEALSPEGRTADQSLLDHLTEMLGVPRDTDVRRSVLRMELDVTGDGKPELFLSATWTGSQNGMVWVVYTPRADGRYQPLGVLVFGYDSFYYSAKGSYVCGAVHTGATTPGFAYYHVGADGILEITERSFRPAGDPVAKMREWQAKGRPQVYEDTLADVKASATPQWKDPATKEVVSSVGKLDTKVTESGDCSAEKFLGDYRNAGCLPKR